MHTNASFHSPAYLGLHTFEDGGAWIYIIVHQSAAFDALPGEYRDNADQVGTASERRVQTKEIRQGQTLVVFQHWPNSAAARNQP